jgi:hypothetical protein
MFAVPALLLVGAGLEAIRFAVLVTRGRLAITHARNVRAKRVMPALAYGTYTDVEFEYQGGGDGVNLQGRWGGRIRYGRQPAEGQAMPVLFDADHPGRRLLLWAYGLTTRLGEPRHSR